MYYKVLGDNPYHKALTGTHKVDKSVVGHLCLSDVAIVKEELPGQSNTFISGRLWANGVRVVCEYEMRGDKDKVVMVSMNIEVQKNRRDPADGFVSVLECGPGESDDRFIKKGPWEESIKAQLALWSSKLRMLERREEEEDKALFRDLELEWGPSFGG